MSEKMKSYRQYSGFGNGVQVAYTLTYVGPALGGDVYVIELSDGKAGPAPDMIPVMYRGVPLQVCSNHSFVAELRPSK
jgi:hypothetical protein